MPRQWACTARASKTSWALFPPRTTEVQFDERWAFVGILQAYGEEFTPPRPRGPGRPPKPRLVAPPGLVYATVH
jgi:hypothetical protein